MKVVINVSDFFLINSSSKVLDSRWSEALKTLDLVLLLQQPAKDDDTPSVRVLSIACS